MFWDTLSTFFNVVGAQQNASAQQQAATYNRNIASLNSNIATKEGVIESTQQRQTAEQTIGQMRANAGASGFDVSGSAEDAIFSSAYQANIDAQTIRWNTAMKVKGYNLEAQKYNTEAQNAPRAGFINAASALVKGGAKAYGDQPTSSATPFQL